MREINTGQRCPFAQQCPVYSGEVQIENTSLYLIKNVFCNRGKKGWYNCNRYQIVISGDEVPEAATPYHPKLGKTVDVEKISDETERKILKLIKQNGKCLMGEVLMKLKMGNEKGYYYFNQLLQKKWITNTEKPPYYTLTIELS